MMISTRPVKNGISTAVERGARALLCCALAPT